MRFCLLLGLATTDNVVPLAACRPAAEIKGVNSMLFVPETYASTMVISSGCDLRTAVTASLPSREGARPLNFVYTSRTMSSDDASPFDELNNARSHMKATNI